MEEKTITFEQYKKDWEKGSTPYIPYLSTSFGEMEVTGIRTFSDGDSAVCGKANAGFGRSFMVKPQAVLKIKIGSKYDVEREIREGKIKEEKTMVDIGKLIRLRNLILTAIDITKEDMNAVKEGTRSHSYRLGMLHCQEDIKDKLNALISMG